MVHIWGPVISPTKMTNDGHKRVVTVRPNLSVKDAWRPLPDANPVPRHFLKELIIRIRRGVRAWSSH